MKIPLCLCANKTRKGLLEIQSYNVSQQETRIRKHSYIYQRAFMRNDLVKMLIMKIIFFSVIL